MPRREPDSPNSRHSIDWPAWIALGWALCFGFLYARMLVEQKAPRLLSVVRHAGRH